MSDIKQEAAAILESLKQSTAQATEAGVKLEETHKRVSRLERVLGRSERNLGSLEQELTKLREAEDTKETAFENLLKTARAQIAQVQTDADASFKAESTAKLEAWESKASAWFEGEREAFQTITLEFEGIVSGAKLSGQSIAALVDDATAKTDAFLNQARFQLSQVEMGQPAPILEPEAHPALPELAQPEPEIAPTEEDKKPAPRRKP